MGNFTKWILDKIGTTNGSVLNKPEVTWYQDGHVSLSDVTQRPWMASLNASMNVKQLGQISGNTFMTCQFILAP